ncbi:MAG: nitrate- and nitrite sensing domain-containing protein [Micromonosporaceae bacterium]
MRARVIVAVVAMSLLLLVVVGYAGWLTFGPGLELRGIDSYHRGVYQPTERLVTALQDEREVSARALAGDRQAEVPLEAARSTVDETWRDWKKSVSSQDVQSIADEALKRRFQALRKAYAGLAQTRSQVDSGAISTTQALKALSRVVAATPIYASPATSVSGLVTDEHQLMVAIHRAREATAQEVAALSGALTTGEVTHADMRTMLRIAGARERLLDDAIATAPASDRDRVRQLASGDALTDLADAEDVTLSELRKTPHATWLSVGEAALTDLRVAETSSAVALAKRAEAQADSSLFQAALVALGLVVFVAGLMVVWLVVAPRHVLDQLAAAKADADSWAATLLRLQDLLRDTRDPNVAIETPPPPEGADEFGLVRQAIAEGFQKASDALREQTRQHVGTREATKKIAYRLRNPLKQLHRILADLQKRATSSEEMERLYPLDHHVTQAMSDVQKMLVVAGERGQRARLDAEPMENVIRAALQECLHYQRVQLGSIHPAAMHGRVFGDVVQLLSVFMDNATRFSPPSTDVIVTGEAVSNGYAVEIVDKGIGLKDGRLERFNELLGADRPPELRPEDIPQLGMVVAATLAAHYNIKITLRRSDFDGVRVIVLLGAELLAGQPAELLKPIARTEAKPVEAVRAAPTVVPLRVPAALPAAAIEAAPPERRPSPAPRNSAEKGALPQRRRQAGAADEPGNSLRTIMGSGGSVDRAPEKVQDRYRGFQAGGAAAREQRRRGLPEVPLDGDE